MKRPVWHLELIRDTDAPLETVARALADSPSYAKWHPRLRNPRLRVGARGPGGLEVSYGWRPCPGVDEEGVFRIVPHGDRLLLEHRARFKGWPVLLLMGWWRLRSHRIWERLVASL